MSRKSRGIKPQDIAILGKLITDENWPSQKEVSIELEISQSEVSLGFKALESVGLISVNSKKLHKIAIKEFLTCAIKYFVPLEKYGIGRGYFAGPSALEFGQKVHSDDYYIWPHENGDSKGVVVKPVLAKIPESVINNEKLYLFLSIVDIYRGLGGVRHIKEANKSLERLLNE
ncbi:MAG: hypothetical protein N4A33_12810 [Bacteriovoracaceae bacterium]|jgi:hypothetical protein|nr:hypothetical protein [Bacteriovoracaceae bacterium]